VADARSPCSHLRCSHLSVVQGRRRSPTGSGSRTSWMASPTVRWRAAIRCSPPFRPTPSASPRRRRRLWRRRPPSGRRMGRGLDGSGTQRNAGGRRPRGRVGPGSGLSDGRSWAVMPTTWCPGFGLNERW